jgi:aspartate 1-decarboxylase
MAVSPNGAAAHLARPGDLIIVATYTQLEDAAARAHRPRIVLVDADNRIRTSPAEEVAGPKRRSITK